MNRSVALLVLCAASVAQAAPSVIRFSSPAPEGTAWAREGLAFKRDVESLTHGQVTIKLYFGGITGEEMQTVERVRRDQLDGFAHQLGRLGAGQGAPAQFGDGGQPGRPGREFLPLSAHGVGGKHDQGTFSTRQAPALPFRGASTTSL